MQSCLQPKSNRCNPRSRCNCLPQQEHQPSSAQLLLPLTNHAHTRMRRGKSSMQPPGTVPSTVMTRSGTRPATSDDNTSQNTCHSGQCSRCFRVLSLTSASLLHPYGPGCSESGQMPIDGSVTSVILLSNPAVQATASDSSNEVSVRPKNGEQKSQNRYNSPLCSGATCEPISTKFGVFVGRTM